MSETIETDAYWLYNHYKYNLLLKYFIEHQRLNLKFKINK